MARPSLPTVGSSTDTWGTELNTVLTDLRNSLDDARFDPATYVQTGKYITPQGAVPSTFSAQIVETDTLVLVPIYCGPNGITVDRIAIGVAAEDTGNIRLGIYEDDGRAPGDLITDHGVIAVASSGLKEITISATYAPSASPYWIWAAYVSDGGPIIMGYTGSGDAFGQGGVSGLFGNAGYDTYAAYSMSHTYGALPSSAASATLLAPSGTSGEECLPIIALRST